MRRNCFFVNGSAVKQASLSGTIRELHVESVVCVGHWRLVCAFVCVCMIPSLTQLLFLFTALTLKHLSMCLCRSVLCLIFTLTPFSHSVQPFLPTHITQQIPCPLKTAIMRRLRGKSSAPPPPVPEDSLVPAPAISGSLTYPAVIVWNQSDGPDHTYENDVVSAARPAVALAASAGENACTGPTSLPDNLARFYQTRLWGEHCGSCLCASADKPGCAGIIDPNPTALAGSDTAPTFQLRASDHLYGNVMTVGDDDEDRLYVNEPTGPAGSATGPRPSPATTTTAPGTQQLQFDLPDYVNCDVAPKNVSAAPAHTLTRYENTAEPPDTRGPSQSTDTYEDTGGIPFGAGPPPPPRPPVTHLPLYVRMPFSIMYQRVCSMQAYSTDTPRHCPSPDHWRSRYRPCRARRPGSSLAIMSRKCSRT